MNRNTLTILAVAATFLGAAGLTAAGFITFIPPWQRKDIFYITLVSSSMAELIFFAALAYSLTARFVRGQPEAAPRNQTLALLFFWAAMMVTTGSWAAAPSHADMFFSDKILFFQAVLTLFAFAGVVFFQRQAAVVAERQAAPHQERRELQADAVNMDSLLDMVRAVASARRDRSSQLDRLAKKLDAIKSQLQFASTVQRADASVKPLPAATNPEVCQQLQELEAQVRQLKAASDATFDQELSKTGDLADHAAAALRRREAAASF